MESIARSKKASILFYSILFYSILFYSIVARLGYFPNQDNIYFLSRKMRAAEALGLGAFNLFLYGGGIMSRLPVEVIYE